MLRTGSFTSGDVRVLKRASEEGKTAVFMLGKPGAGKSSVSKKNFLSKGGWENIDSDAIKESHPDYNPDDPAALHEWSSKKAKALLHDTITEGKKSFVYDGTGNNVDKYMDAMKKAKAAGYKVKLVRAHVPDEVAHMRNRKRQRYVPDKVVDGISKQIDKSFDILSKSGLVDDADIHTINTSTPEEHEVAKKYMKDHPMDERVYEKGEKPQRPPIPHYVVNHYGEDNIEAFHGKDGKVDPEKKKRLHIPKHENLKPDEYHRVHNKCPHGFHWDGMHCVAEKAAGLVAVSDAAIKSYLGQVFDIHPHDGAAYTKAFKLFRAAGKKAKTQKEAIDLGHKAVSDDIDKRYS